MEKAKGTMEKHVQWASMGINGLHSFINELHSFIDFCFADLLQGYERDPLSHPAATDQQIDWSSLAAVGLAAAGAVAFTQGSHD